MQTGNEGNDDGVGLQFRLGREEDLSFIADSWRRSYDDGPYTNCPGGLMEYIVTQQRVIQQCLKSSLVLVANPAGSEGQILGWCCYRWGNEGQLASGPAGLVLHYLYVKASFRRNGVGRALIDTIVEASPTVVQVYASHFLPRQGVPRWLASWRIHFNPALIFAPTGGTE